MPQRMTMPRSTSFDPTNETHRAALADIVAQGHTEAVAEDMLSTFLGQGGLVCCLRWPEPFSIFSPEGPNVVDVLLKHKLF